MKNVVNIGIIGYGVVGSGTVETLLKNKETIRKKTGVELNIVGVASKNLSGDEPNLKNIYTTENADELINNPAIDVIVELIGGYTYAKTYILDAIRNGKHIVTANKALLALHGKEIFSAAHDKNVEIGFEASVGGGIPIINVIKENLAANNIVEIYAIINGTSNYILSRMVQGSLPYEEALKEAQNLGYAEADPTFDVEGIDSAHKITLLAAIAFGSWIKFDQVYTKGITQIASIDIELAKELDCTIKLLAIAKKDYKTGEIEVCVQPTIIPLRYVLASVNDSFNAVRLTSDIAGVTLHYGRGAGGRPTSSAVVADIASIARNIKANSINRVEALGFTGIEDGQIKSIGDISSQFYLRFNVSDQPGALSIISGVLAKNNISIQSAFQRPNMSTQAGRVPLVFLTYSASGKQLTSAIAEIDQLNVVHGKTVVIQVMV